MCTFSLSQDGEPGEEDVDYKNTCFVYWGKTRLMGAVEQGPSRSFKIWRYKAFSLNGFLRLDSLASVRESFLLCRMAGGLGDLLRMLSSPE